MTHNKYIVLEGNRRVCACKNLVDKHAQNNEHADLLSNISLLEVVVYKTRELAQPYISDKHIDGVKKWESIEKSCYYYRMYQEKKQQDTSLSSDMIVDEIVRQTTSKKAEVKECIIKYGFYMTVYGALTEDHSREALVDTNSFLPLVDRFMKILVSKDSEVGLDLPLVELNYVAHNGKEEMLKSILKLIGEAFLVRKPENQCSPGELPRINSKEVDKQIQQKKLIKNDERIPGLFALIEEYNKASVTPVGIETNAKMEGEDFLPISSDSADADSRAEKESKSAISDENANPNVDQSVEIEGYYEPTIPWKPKLPQNKRLCFSSDDGRAFKLHDENDHDVKIKFVILALSKLSIDKYPYSCTSLYRLLLETATQKAYREKKPKENKNIILYNDNRLPEMISKLAKNSILFLTEAERANVVKYINKKKLVGILNDYMHNPKQVNTETLLSSWITMKDYIKACLK